MILVSGCPRSGTSLMMDIMRSVFGKDRVLGKKFPQEERAARLGKQQPGETDGQFKVRQYIEKKNRLKERLEQEMQQTKDLNPNGFWEMLYTVQGCHYRFWDRKRLEKIKKAKKPYICKVVSQGLINTDPQYVDKVIFMLRSPRAVAKSQERLKRAFPFDKESGLTLHTPEMFLSVTYSAAQWLHEHPHIPVKTVEFDALVENPKQVLREIAAFIGEGDWADAYKRINPKLRRSSTGGAHERDIWREAEDLYALMVQQDYKGVMDYIQTKGDATKKQNSQIYCSRLQTYMAYAECLSCHESENFVRNKINQAEKTNIDWRTEPCLFECGADIGRENYIEIEDSIKNNHWLTVFRNNANSRETHTQELSITDLYENIYR